MFYTVEKEDAAKISRFLEEVFHFECLAMEVKEGAIANLSITPYYDIETTFTEQEIVKSLLTATQAVGVANQRFLKISCSYLAHKNGEKWQAESLLFQDDWLEAQKVHQAFVKISLAKGWGGIVEVPVLCECKVMGWYSTTAWVSIVNGHTLCCLVQNGLILINQAQDVFPVWNETVVNAEDCIFNTVYENDYIVNLKRI